MKFRKPSKTLLVTLVLVLLAIVYAIFSSVRAARLREASIPSLPSSDISASTDEKTPLNSIDYSKVSITTDNVAQVIRELKRPESFYYETQSELFTDEGSQKYLRKTWKQGDWHRIDVLSSAAVTTMHIIYGKEKAFFWEPNSRSYYTTSIGEITVDEAQMMMSYEDILTLSPDEIISAGFTTYENQGCIHVIAHSKSSGYQTEYWISTEHGLLLAGQAKKGEFMFYTIKLNALNLSVQEEVVFRLPNGTLAMNA